VRGKVLQLLGAGAAAVPVGALAWGWSVSPLEVAASGLAAVGSLVATWAINYYGRRYVLELSLLCPRATKGRDDDDNDDDDNDDDDRVVHDGTNKIDGKGAISHTMSSRTDDDVEDQDLSTSHPLNYVPTVVRFSSLDFWGNRLDYDCHLSVVAAPFAGVPTARLRRLTTQPLLPWRVVGHQQYFLTFRYGERLDEHLLRQLMTGELHKRAGVPVPADD
jgi:hypothetical protein